MLERLKTFGKSFKIFSQTHLYCISSKTYLSKLSRKNIHIVESYKGQKKLEAPNCSYAISKSQN